MCACAYVCVYEVLAITWQTRQGGAARGLLIIMGGAVCVCVWARLTEREKGGVMVRDKDIAAEKNAHML